jgi:hypothetical protein
VSTKVAAGDGVEQMIEDPPELIRQVVDTRKSRQCCRSRTNTRALFSKTRDRANGDGSKTTGNEGEKQQVFYIGKGELHERIVVDATVSQEQFARIAHLAMRLNSAFGSLGEKPDAGVQRYWREMVTKKWKEKGLIGPEDPSFLYLAARNPDKAEVLLKGLQKANTQVIQAQLGNRLAPEFESWDDLEETKLPDLKIILEGIRCSGWLGGGKLALKPTGSSISGKF